MAPGILLGLVYRILLSGSLVVEGVWQAPGSSAFEMLMKTARSGWLPGYRGPRTVMKTPCLGVDFNVSFGVSSSLDF